MPEGETAASTSCNPSAQRWRCAQEPAPGNPREAGQRARRNRRIRRRALPNGGGSDTGLRKTMLPDRLKNAAGGPGRGLHHEQGIQAARGANGMVAKEPNSKRKAVHLPKVAGLACKSEQREELGRSLRAANPRAGDATAASCESS